MNGLIENYSVKNSISSSIVYYLSSIEYRWFILRNIYEVMGVI